MYRPDPIELKVRMLRCGLRQVDVARHLGISKNAVSRAVNGVGTSRRVLRTIDTMCRKREKERSRAS